MEKYSRQPVGLDGEVQSTTEGIDGGVQLMANAVSFLDSNYQEQFKITCPVFKTAVNGFGYCKQETYKVIFLLWLFVCFSV
jgi:hypothetical protein